MRITLYGWLQYDPTLFDDVTLPNTFDKQYMIDEIIMRSGDLFTYHQEPTYLKRNITNWFNRNYEQFLRMMDALIAEYNPIENYDRTEDTTTTPGVTRTEAHTGTDKHYESGTDTEAASGTDTESYSGTDSEDHAGTDGRNIKSYPTATRNTENQVSAYDSSAYSPKDKTIVTGSGYDESQDDFTHGESIDTTYGKSIGTTYGKSVGTTYGHHLDLTHGESITNSVTGYDTFHSRVHGNIGVTTNAQMVTQELELRKFDIYTDIARRFEKEFLIQIY